MFKRILCLLVILSVMCSMVVSPVFGETTDCGITIEPFKASLNGRIEYANGTIYVYSHPMSTASEYKVKSDDLIKSIKASDNYDISYVDEDKKNTVSSDVRDGYIKLSDMNDTTYIPVKSQTSDLFTETFENVNFSDNKYFRIFPEDGGVKHKVEYGVAGKSKDDASYVIKGVGGENFTLSYLQLNSPVTVDGVRTLEFMVCNSSNCSASFSYYSRAESLFEFKSDGSVKTHSGSVEVGELGLGVWHRVCIVFDYGRNRIFTYVDGVFQDDETYINFSNSTVPYVKFNMKYDGVPASGMIAYDDIRIYGGYPHENNEFSPGILSDTLYIDNQNNVIWGAVGKSSTEFLSETIGEQSGEISVVDDRITTDTTAVVSITDKFGKKHNYEFSFAEGMYVSPLSVKNEGEGTQALIKANLVICPPNNIELSDVLFCVASYDRNSLIAVECEKYDVSSKRELSLCLETERENISKTKVFLWDENLMPISCDIYADTERRNVFESDDTIKELMKNYVSVHPLSGLITYYGKKICLENMPYTKNGYVYIPAEETAQKLGIDCEIFNLQITKNDKYISLSDEDIVNGVPYIKADIFFEELLALKTYTLDCMYNGGAIIAGHTVFDKALTDDEAQSLNDYLFNLRPDSEFISTMYDLSPLKGMHPRIHISPNDAQRIIADEIHTNTYKKEWKTSIINYADYCLKADTVKYEVDNGRLLGVSRKMLDYMYTFGMAYLITGDKKYSDKAYIQLEAASKFPDWNPEHALDTGEMSAAFGVGYDWMYDAFTPDQRKVIEQGFYKNGIAAANNLYEGTSGRVGAVTATGNWCSVVNGGIATAAMAFYDAYPKSCATIISNAIRGYESIYKRFYPQGGWFEGVSYWEYMMKYAVKMASNLNRIFGIDLSIIYTDGFDTTVDYALHMNSSCGIYSYGDAMTNRRILIPEIFWLAEVLDKPEYVSVLLNLSDGNWENSEDNALAICLYDVNTGPDEVLLDKQAWIKGEDVLSIRSGWGKNDTYFAASAGSTSGTAVHLDSGSFIFDSQGERWVTDLGQGNYNSTDNYWDCSPGGERWKVFHIRAEAHSTVVINPTTEEDHKIDTYSQIERFEHNDQSGIAVIDMSEVLSENVLSAKRAFIMCDNRNSLVVRDEILLENNDNDVYWFLMTKADVEIVSDGAVLSIGNKKLYLKIKTNCEYTLSCSPATPLDTTGVIVGSARGVNRISLNLKASDYVQITASLSASNSEEFVNKFHNSISSWILE